MYILNKDGGEKKTIWRLYLEEFTVDILKNAYRQYDEYYLKNKPFKGVLNHSQDVLDILL